MSLPLEMCLRGVLDTLQIRIAPALTDTYAAEIARLTALVLTLTTNSIDDAAAIRIAENAALRSIFRDAADVISDGGLLEKLQEAGVAQDTGYRLSELDADNGQLRGLLVELHVAVEQLPGDAAKMMSSRIWRMLKDFEVARAPRR